MNERLIQLLEKYNDNYPPRKTTPPPPATKPPQLTKTELKTRRLNDFCYRTWGMSEEEANNARIVWFYQDELRALNNPNATRGNFRYQDDVYIPSKTARKLSEIGVLFQKRQYGRVNLELVEHYLSMPSITQCIDAG